MLEVDFQNPAEHATTKCKKNKTSDMYFQLKKHKTCASQVRLTDRLFFLTKTENRAQYNMLRYGSVSK